MKVGFIGCGNMASAMLGGIIQKGVVAKEDLMASARTEKTRKKIKEEFQIAAIEDNKELAAKSDIIVLAIKPVYMEEVIEEIAECVTEEKIIVTLAPGKTLEWLDVTFGKPTTARMSFSLNSPRRLWTILAVFSEELPPLNAASSVLLNMHSLF